MRCGGIACRADCAHHQDLAASLIETAQQIEACVDDAPGEIAAESTQEHRLHVCAACCGDAQSARVGEHHDQAEQYFGDSISWIEHAVEPHLEASVALDSYAVARR